MADRLLPSRIQHYRVERMLGEGGMGTVVAALDERLHRHVALKLLHRDALPAAGGRLWREARAAAAVRHPAICQVYDVGEDDLHLFIAMELLEGETLAARVARGPLPATEAVALSLALLDALEAVHANGLLHRDLKPSNMMLTPHGLRVLDFGLARPPLGASAGEGLPTIDVTHAGTLVGTPAYMAPELIEGGDASVRSDMFAVGAILFEMLAGRPAFYGANWLATAHAIVHDSPPALTGGPAIAAIDRAIHRAIHKQPAQRFESAAAFAAALRDIQLPDSAHVVMARPARRVIVLPFRALRRDDDVDFLSASLPDAVTATLSQLDSVVVRSSLLAAQFGPAADLRRVASEADVDLALTGTLFRAGDEMRLSAQLVAVPAGTITRSFTYQAPARNLIELHDSIVRSIVDELAGELSVKDQERLARDAPASQTAYAMFLRANELARDRRRLAEAVSRYRESLTLDPHFAPAWAQLGRSYRLSAKYEASPVEHLKLARDALDRALSLNPDLDAAHSVYAQLDADLGHTRAALQRLLGRAAARDAAPDIYAGLVYATRFCGLAAESIAFHEEATRLDPRIPTSVTQTFFQTQDYLRCLETAGEDLGYIGPAALDALGRREDAIAELRLRLSRGMAGGGARLLIESLLATLTGDAARCRQLVEQFLAGGYVGCEAQAYAARQLIAVGEHDAGLAWLARSVANGYHSVNFFEGDSRFDAVRADARFMAVVEQARLERDASRATFVAGGGNELLARRVR
jgi:serine/threonine protein kinase